MPQCRFRPLGRLNNKMHKEKRNLGDGRNPDFCVVARAQVTRSIAQSTEGRSADEHFKLIKTALLQKGNAVGHLKSAQPEVQTARALWRIEWQTATLKDKSCPDLDAQVVPFFESAA